jgi:hypothetical protein
MNEAEEINFKSARSPRKRKLDRKFSVGLLVVGLIPAVFLYCRYIDHLTHVHVPAKASRTVSSTNAPSATSQPKLAASAPKPDDQLAPVKSDNETAPHAAAGFADSLMSVLVPSAKAVTLQQEMLPASKPAKPVATLAAMRPSSDFNPQPLTAAQKRWQVAQDGFGKVMDLAADYRDTYGFSPDEKLWTAELGKPIPVYTIPQAGLVNYDGRPLTSLLTPADEWLFPIMLDNHIRFMIQVRYDGHEYVLGHGSRSLAMVYEKILARWPASQGFHPQLVINPKMPYYYFTIPEQAVPNITDTSRMLDANPALSPATLILSSWR